MRKIIITLGLFVFCISAKAQIEGTSIPSLPQLTTAEMNGAIGVNIGSSVFNTTEQKVYTYTTSGWVTTSDDQDASEVNSDTPVDVDGDGNTEVTVEDVIQDIAPITSASGRIFYPPSIEIDAATNGTGRTVNLYQEYVNQFGNGNANLVRSVDGGTTAPDIPIYAANELYYYVTFFDPLVFSNLSIDGATGIMTYSIIDQPADYNSLINVVFVVK